MAVVTLPPIKIQAKDPSALASVRSGPLAAALRHELAARLAPGAGAPAPPGVERDLARQIAGRILGRIKP